MISKWTTAYLTELLDENKKDFPAVKLIRPFKILITYEGEEPRIFYAEERDKIGFQSFGFGKTPYEAVKELIGWMIFELRAYNSRRIKLDAKMKFTKRRLEEHFLINNF